MHDTDKKIGGSTSLLISVITTMLGMYTSYFFFHKSPSSEIQADIAERQIRIEERVAYSSYPELKNLFNAGYIMFISGNRGKIVSIRSSVSGMSMNWDSSYVAINSYDSYNNYSIEANIYKMSYVNYVGGGFDIKHLAFDFQSQVGQVKMYNLYRDEYHRIEIGFLMLETGEENTLAALGLRRSEAD